MDITSEHIRERIKYIRKTKQRSIQDCAKILQIPEKQYLHLEDNPETFSLPQIELLAFFLEVHPKAFFTTSDIEEKIFPIFNEITTPQFITLRNKIIRTQLAIERERKDISIENIQDATKIPIEILRFYDKTEMPIPFNHLFVISKHLSLPFDDLLLNDYQEEDPIEASIEQTQLQNEYPEVQESQEEQQENVYQQLFIALKLIPEKDQAEIAKIILRKLKTAA